MITDAIKNFPKQFEFNPEVVNQKRIKRFSGVVVGGMGGSGLVAGILRAIKPELNIITHHEYGLPTFLEKIEKKTLFIAISYSGNTEETVDFLKEATNKKLNTAVISTGGEILRVAKENKLPYIEIPNTGIQPRMALGYMIRALLKILGEEKLFNEVEELSKELKQDLENEGKKLADELKNKIPVIYSSRRNQTLAYNWKIKFNETGKIPSFYNTVPELNHNEMTGFDVYKETKNLSENIHFIFLFDEDDDSRVIKRMQILKDLYENRGLSVTKINVSGKTRAERIFNSLIIADWTSYYTALNYEVEPEQVPMVEEFKKLL